MAKETSFLRAVAGQTFWDLAVHGLAAALAALISLTAIDVLSVWSTPLKEHKAPAIAVLTVVILLVAIKIYMARTRFMPVFPQPEFDFLILDKEISIRFFSLEDIRYRKAFKLKALRKGLDRYTDKYKWSGSGAVTVCSEHDEHELVLTNRSALWQWYDLRFDRALRKGDTIEIAILWKIEDKGRTAIPFISATIEEPTDTLTMRVWGTDFFGIKQATCEHKATMGSRKPFWTRVEKAHNGEMVWEIPRPRLLHYYEMHWTPHIKENT
jgi:hypothetical protein